MLTARQMEIPTRNVTVVDVYAKVVIIRTMLEAAYKVQFFGCYPAYWDNFEWDWVTLGGGVTSKWWHSQFRMVGQPH